MKFISRPSLSHQIKLVRGHFASVIKNPVFMCFTQIYVFYLNKNLHIK